MLDQKFVHVTLYIKQKFQKSTVQIIGFTYHLYMNDSSLKSTCLSKYPLSVIILKETNKQKEKNNYLLKALI